MISTYTVASSIHNTNTLYIYLYDEGIYYNILYIWFHQNSKIQLTLSINDKKIIDSCGIRRTLG